MTGNKKKPKCLFCYFRLLFYSFFCIAGIWIGLSLLIFDFWGMDQNSGNIYYRTPDRKISEELNSLEEVQTSHIPVIEPTK
jgi:hypothetical protein